MSRTMLSAIRTRKNPTWDTNLFVQALGDAVQDTADQVIADYRKATSTWEHQPVFRIMARTARVGNRFTSVDVGTDDEIFGYVDLGTKPHVIRPKNGKVLAFKTGGSPKTRPNRLLATGGSAGTDQAFAKEVHHPGTKARNFSKLLYTKHSQRNTLGKALQSRITAAAAKGG